jgi:hypothetical protein
MTPAQIAADIERGKEIKAEIAKLTAELKLINARLQAAGEASEHVPLADADREGKQAILRGTRHSLPVIFESDLLIASFKPDSLKHTEIKAILGENLPKFFRDTRVFERIQEDGKAFRKFARENLPADTFAKLVQACTDRKKDGIAKSRVVVDWDAAKPLETVAAD